MVIKEARSGRKCLALWSPVIPAVHQSWGNSELQAATHFALLMSHSFYISISFGCGQGQKVSAVPWLAGGKGRGPGSQGAALFRKWGSGEGGFALVTSAWAEQEKRSGE